MKLLVTYCLTPDGSGTDKTVEISTACTLYSIHTKEIDLIDSVCYYMGIGSFQIIRIKLSH